jgi:hypothetical protein
MLLGMRETDAMALWAEALDDEANSNRFHGTLAMSAPFAFVKNRHLRF